MKQEINQLARAKLAKKNGLRVMAQLEDKMCISGYQWKEVGCIQEWRECLYKCHPEDNAKLDAIIWEGMSKDVVYAYLSNRGGVLRCYSNPLKTELAKDCSLIATRELPAENHNESQKKYNKAIRAMVDRMPIAEKPSYLATRELPADKTDVLLDGLSKETSNDFMMMKNIEEAQLFADLKEFVEHVKSDLIVDHDNHYDIVAKAKKLCERINPKPKRCSSQLPVDTLCEVWGSPESLDIAYSDGVGGFYSNGLTSKTGASTACLDGMNFKVLEQPNPTFWQGGECPVPDWVEFEYTMRCGQKERCGIASEVVWQHDTDGIDVDAEIIAYQIMGEKE